ncbi:MAG: M20 family metallopeptidase [Bacillota bacterium]
MKELLERANQLLPRLVEIRRDLHRHPELGMEEVRTAGIVAAILEELGTEVKTGVGGTGVVGLLRGARPGKTIALRADMDALPVADQKEVDYRSQEPGKMHACGHDGHTTALLGAAMLLASLRHELSGNVKFLFQPAEEGPGGAEPMIAAGAMKNPKVDAIIGAHLAPRQKVGEIGILAGPISAATDQFNVTITGQGGHGAHPEGTVDPIVIAAQAIVNLQQITSRETSAFKPLVVTVGTINGGYRYNVIPDRVSFSGTVRTTDPALRATMPDRLRRIIGGICQAHRAEFEFEYIPGYPPNVNDAAMCEFVAGVARELLGPEAVVTDVPSMGGEDFSYFGQLSPSCFYRLGGGDSEQYSFPLHNPRFDFDERALAVGAALMAACARKYLS